MPEYLPLKYFDGREYSDSIAMDRLSFAMAYGMINRAAYDNAGLMPFEQYFNTSKLLNDSSDAVLSAIYFRYNRFKDNVVEDNLIVVDTVAKKFYRGSNTSTTPYLEDTILLMTSIVNESHSLTQQFTIDESMFFTNMPNGFIGAEIDFDDNNGYSEGVLLYPICDTVWLPDPYDGYIDSIDFDIECSIDGVQIWHFKNELCGDEGIRKALIMLDGFDADDKYGVGRSRS